MLIYRPIVLFSAALLVMLLALDLLGVNRGEVIRLWIFLACLFQVPAVYVCVRLGKPPRLSCSGADADDRPLGAGDRDHRLRGAVSAPVVARPSPNAATIEWEQLD